MAFFVSVLGWSGTGKTRLVAGALAECRRRGLAAAAVKRAHHEPDLAPAGKDSTLFLEAGALASLYVGDRGSALFLPSPAAPDRGFYERLLPGADIVFLEGARAEGALVVLVGGGAKEPAELKLPPAEADILVTADRGLALAGREAGLEVLDPDEFETLVDIMEARRGT